MEEKAPRAYDLVAFKCWGPSTHVNFLVWSSRVWCTWFMWWFLETWIKTSLLFQLENYQEELEEMKNMSAHLRR